MKFKRLICLICAISLLLLSFAGCGGANNNPTSTTTSASSGDTQTTGDSTTAAPTQDFSEKMKFTWSCLGELHIENNPWFDEVFKRFNIEMEILPITWDNWTEKNRVWLSSGDTPDLMWYDTYNYGDYVKYAKQGAMRALPSIENYPNLQKFAKENVPNILQKLTIDGKLYGWPHALRSNPYNEVVTYGYYYRKDWAEKIGYNQDKFTPDQFLQFVKDIIAKDPGGLGPGKTVGLVTLGWWVPGMTGMSWFNPYYSNYTKRDGKYVWGAEFPETIDGINFCKKMYDEGVLYKDIFTMKSDEGTALFTAGRAAVYADVLQVIQLDTTLKSFAEKNPGVDPEKAIGYLHIVDENGKVTTSQNNEYWCTTLMGHQLSDEKAERALAMMDWLCSDEGTNWIALGIEGKDWTLGADGKPVVNWAKDANGAYVDPGYGVVDFRHLAQCEGGLAELSPNYPDYTKKAVKDYLETEKALAKEVIKIDYDLSFANTPLGSKFGSFSKDISDEIIKLIVSSKDVEKDWNSWLAEMKPRVEPVLKEINDALTK